LVEVDEALLDQPLHQSVEELGDLPPHLLVPLPLAAQLAQHLRGELAALDERAQERVLERVERAVLVAELAPEGVLMRAAGEAALQQEVGEPLEQVLEVHRVGPVSAVAGIVRESHPGLHVSVAASARRDRPRPPLAPPLLT
jgi:hypothetical protein